MKYVKGVSKGGMKDLETKFPLQVFGIQFLKPTSFISQFEIS
jgi:hypothetical protein